jgi:hypothetical protein
VNWVGLIGALVALASVHAVAPAIIENFSAYENTTHYLADPLNIYDEVETFRADRITLDNTVAYGVNTRSIRYDYPNGTAKDYTISRALNIVPYATELWIEAVVRWDENFTVDGNGQGAGPAQKVLHVGITGGPAGRFGLNIESSTLRAEGPNDDYDDLYLYGAATTSQLFDGGWHVIKYHVRLGENDSHEFWVDGVYQGNESGQTAATGLYKVMLGKNLNMLSDHNMSMWWGQVHIWTQDPQWGAVYLRGDTNDDGVVNLLDVLFVQSYLAGSGVFNARADVRADGVIDLFDLVVVAQSWGATQ